MTLSEKQRKFTVMVGELIRCASQMEYGLTFSWAYRDEEAQKRMVATGLSKTMQSKHLERLAVDFNLFIGGVYQTKKEAYEPLGVYWKSLDPQNRWGGDFQSLGDGNHFEYGG
ncbi:MAG: M15 family metallopeptidase [Deltaproteobacteria bacterium]|nr:M15 family metallopeptidase [Deltaproteobacteria bacterium]